MHVVAAVGFGSESAVAKATLVTEGQLSVWVSSVVRSHFVDGELLFGRTSVVTLCAAESIWWSVGLSLLGVVLVVPSVKGAWCEVQQVWKLLEAVYTTFL